MVIPAKAGIQVAMKSRSGPNLDAGSFIKISRGDDRVERERGRPPTQGPLVWTFDGPFGTCLADIEDTFRRAIVQVGDVSRIAVMIELSLPALRARMHAG